MAVALGFPRPLPSAGVTTQGPTPLLPRSQPASMRSKEVSVGTGFPCHLPSPAKHLACGGHFFCGQGPWGPRSREGAGPDQGREAALSHPTGWGGGPGMLTSDPGTFQGSQWECVLSRGCQWLGQGHAVSRESCQGAQTLGTFYPTRLCRPRGQGQAAGVQGCILLTRGRGGGGAGLTGVGVSGQAQDAKALGRRRLGGAHHDAPTWA